jgi:hypothetical protein
LRSKRCDDTLIQELTAVRDQYAEAASFQARLIDMYDREEERRGREGVIDAITRLLRARRRDSDLRVELTASGDESPPTVVSDALKSNST